MKIIQKLVIITVAIAINFAILAWFHAWSANVVADATVPATTTPVVTLPTTVVRPSAEQVRALREERMRLRNPDQASIIAGAACMAMPYYSFAAQPVECTAG